MKFVLSFLIAALSASASYAVTKPKFLPFDMNFMVAITNSDITGASDNDATDMYNMMNVPEQDSSMGKGKSIKTDAKDFNLVCSKEKQTCSIILNKSANTVIQSGKKYAAFKVTGEVATQLLQQFKFGADRTFTFKATDGVFHIHAQPEAFIFELQIP